MSDTVVSPNNVKVAYRGKPTKERAMPWDAKTFKKHNHSLDKGEAKSAAKQATAVLESGVPEGEAIAIANKQVNRLRKAGKISDRMHAKKTKKYDVATDSNEDVPASTR